MSCIFKPSSGPGDWQELLADPEKQWVRGYSARTLAHCWENANGFPPEITKVLGQYPAFRGAEPLLIFPEWKVPLPGGSTASQNDIWVLAKSEEALMSIAVEGKVEESFGETLAEWKTEASQGKIKRLAWLNDLLCPGLSLPDFIRYQLLHRAASAVIEAKRFRAKHALMLVHSFSEKSLWFDDFSAFVGLFGLSALPNKILSTTLGNGLPMHFAWIKGDRKFLNA
jgi:hypothetical protein